MAAAAAAAVARGLPLIKLKLGGAGDAERLAAVRAACPSARLVADANEAWTPDMLVPLLQAAADARLEVVEQPLPADADAALADIVHPVPICADESLHTRRDLARLRTRYDAINVKLDKAGGLTEALALASEARDAGLRIMVGCMVATSLAMAPAMLVAQHADWVDLDGPLLLARDRTPGLAYHGAVVSPPDAALWG
jgi:L-alanine-DL-glutamate epimerase-like enolase superfamily enzyme